MALLGYAGLLREFGITKHMTWISAMIIETLLLYVFAMLGFLRFGLIAVIVLGCIIEVVRIFFAFFHVGKTKLEGMHYFDIWMIIIGIILGHTLYESTLLHYDNYSHWAVIVKFLLYEGHLPTAADSLISFTSYPPATALFITEYVKWVGFSDGNMLVAQFMLIWASFYAIFAVLRDRTRAMNAFILCFVISITNVFNIAIRMNNLLVDYVLPVITAAAFAGIYAYRHQYKIACFFAFIFSAELMLIKNSGTMYVVMIGCYLWYILMKNTHGGKLKRFGKSISLTAVTMLMGYAPFFW